MSSYIKATPDVIERVKDALNRWHQRLDGANIAVVMKDKASTSKGAKVLGTVQKSPQAMAALFDESYDFIITLAADLWELADEKQKMAIVDHELCHCKIGHNGPEMVGHDYEEFADVIERHGLWRHTKCERSVQMAFDGLKCKKGSVKAL